MSDLSDRAYLALKPAERVRAVLSAAARHDSYELDRLYATCEKKTYRMEDYEVTAPLRKFVQMGLEHNALVNRTALAATTALAGGLAHDPDDERQERLFAILDSGRAALKGIIEAWDAFCREVGLSDEEAASYRPGNDEPIATALSLLDLDAIEADDAAGLKYLAKLRDEWGPGRTMAA